MSSGGNDPLEKEKQGAEERGIIVGRKCGELSLENKWRTPWQARSGEGTLLLLNQDEAEHVVRMQRVCPVGR